MQNEKYTIGVDYGTDSVRAIIVDTHNGQEVGSAVASYPRWKSGLYCKPAVNQFRQHPLDYLEGLEISIKGALAKAPAGTAGKVIAISVDTTGSTPVAVNEKGIPLSLTPEFAENPNAMFVLWKDHTAVEEASQINNYARSWGGVDYTRYEGGVYSSEWFWAKILHVLRADEQVRKAAFSWVEHCDWIPAVLTGNTNPLSLKRSRCAAGHKAMWHEDFNGLPSEEFLTGLDPLLKGLRSRLFEDTYTCDVAAGKITPEWAQKLGLPLDITIGVGSFDAHLGAIGGEIKPYYLSKVMGTSTCDMLIAPAKELEGKLVAGICGQVDGSIIPGMLGMEAGQSAFGDIYAWFSKVLLWPVQNLLQQSEWIDPETLKKIENEMAERMIPFLSAEAAKLPVDESSELALDWMNGRRTPFANQNLKGVISGLNLGSDAPRIFKALVDSTAFGAKMIVDRFLDEGIPIHGVIALGGVAKKSPYVMQTVADVLNMPIMVAKSEQACALGSAMAAAVAGGIYSTVAEAQEAMGNGFETEYIPDAARAEQYRVVYEKYKKLGHLLEKEF